jgi:hypothetical protein
MGGRKDGAVGAGIGAGEAGDQVERPRAAEDRSRVETVQVGERLAQAVQSGSG